MKTMQADHHLRPHSSHHQAAPATAAASSTSNTKQASSMSSGILGAACTIKPCMPGTLVRLTNDRDQSLPAMLPAAVIVPAVPPQNIQPTYSASSMLPTLSYSSDSPPAAAADDHPEEEEQPRAAAKLRTCSKSRFSRVCVFCGAYSGSRLVYQEAAVQLGNELVRRGIGLVYGGGSVGLMGRVSRVVSDGGQQVLGVIPRALMQAEITGQTVGSVVEVKSMHQRKAEMARLADAFIALPGGYGTLEELLEVITWSQLGIHDKPVGLLNVNGYYDYLLAFLDNAVGEGFIQPSARNIFVSAQNSRELMCKLEEYVANHDQVASKHCWESCNGSTSTSGSSEEATI